MTVNRTMQAQPEASDEEPTAQEGHPGRVIQGDEGGSPYSGKEGEDRERRERKGGGGREWKEGRKEKRGEKRREGGVE